MDPVTTAYPPAARTSSRQSASSDTIASYPPVPSPSTQFEVSSADGTALPPVDGGKAAWLFLASAFVLELNVWGYASAFGVIQVYLETHPPFPMSVASISAIGTTSLALQYSLPTGFVILFRRYPTWARPALWTATAVSCGTMLLSSFATKVWHLIVLQGVIGGVCGGVFFAPVLLWLQEWWVVRRGMASGIIFAGTGVGGFVLPFAIGSLLDGVGFRWTVRFWACWTLVTFTLAIATMRPRLPIVKIRSEDRGNFAPIDVSFAKNPIVWLMCGTAFVSAMSFFPISYYLTTYTVNIAPKQPTSTVVLTVLNISITLGQLLCGWFSDRYSYSTMLLVMGVASALSTSYEAFLGLGFADTLPKIFGFAIVFGLFSSNTSVWNAVSQDVAGTNTQMSSLIFCLFSSCRGMASIAGPLTASTLIKASQSTGPQPVWGRFGYAGLIEFVGAMAVLTSIGGVGLAAARGYGGKKWRVTS
ncbi:MFS monocarboxylate transporter [Pseudohyphozyma bogoriensis]|nr:MFS monocarboxylate transporter [Pseudohyphozyma bogoriensis]